MGKPRHRRVTEGLQCPARLGRLANLWPIEAARRRYDKSKGSRHYRLRLSLRITETLQYSAEVLYQFLRHRVAHIPNQVR
jgi:hypothetical protein